MTDSNSCCLPGISILEGAQHLYFSNEKLSSGANDITVDVDSVDHNNSVLYCDSFFSHALPVGRRSSFEANCLLSSYRRDYPE